MDFEETHRVTYYDTVSGEDVQTLSIEAESREEAVRKAYDMASSVFGYGPDIAVR